MRAADETEVIQSGFIWDNLPLVEKEMDAIDFTRLRHAVKINKFPGLRHLNRYIYEEYASMYMQHTYLHLGFRIFSCLQICRRLKNWPGKN
jgi:hypothetical protein